MIFITFFSAETSKEISDALLYKDVGMLPMQFSEKGHESHLLMKAHENSILKKNNLTIIKRKAKIYLFFELFIIIYKGINKDRVVVNFYHYTLSNVIKSIILKLFSKKIIVYIKLDMDAPSLDRTLDKSNLIKRVARNFKNYLAENTVDLFSCETHKIFNSLKNFRHYIGRLVVVPNGVSDGEVLSLNKYSYAKTKDNIILTVGRIGSHQKNNELMLDILGRIDSNLIADWEIRFVGPVESDVFLEKVSKYNIEKKPNVQLIGNISEREKIKYEYARAKIFIFTSRYEGASLALMEACSNACKIFSTRVGQVDDLNSINNSITIIDPDDLNGAAEKISAYIKCNDKTMKDGLDSLSIVEKRYKWSMIVDELIGEINVR